MIEEQRTVLAQELVELFDMKKARIRDAKVSAQEDNETQRDIRSLILMFRDGIPDVVIKVSETESLKWDASLQKLLYSNGNSVQVVEGTSREIRIKVRPFLIEMVRTAKDFYRA